MMDTQSISEMFTALGDPAHDGAGFAFTNAALKQEFGDMDALPKPAYEHAIFVDGVTDHYLVLRPTEGTYGEFGAMQRVR